MAEAAVVAKQSTPKGGNSHIRFIMLEADLSEGDLSQVTQAIQNALRPTQQITRLVQIAHPKAGDAESDDVLDSDEAEEFDLEAAERPKERQARTSKPRASRVPTVLDDIDVSTDPSLKDFVSQFEISTNFDKYLVIALWFRDARNINAVTVDHVYTCFKLLGWSTATNDFLKPLQNLKGEQSVKGGAKDGFTLTLTGAGKIEAKKRAA